MSNEENTTPEVIQADVKTEPLVNTTEVKTPSFLDSLPEDLRGEPSLANIKDVASLAKSHVSAQRMIGSSIRIPGPDASDEAKTEFFNKLSTVPGVVKLPDPSDKAGQDAFLEKMGRPKTAEEYKISLDPSIQATASNIEPLKALAHEMGLTQAQLDRYVAHENQLALSRAQAEESHKAETKSFLKETWGKDFDARLTAAKDVMSHFAAKFPEEAKEILNSRIGSNKIFLQMAAELGKSYSESGVIKGTSELKFGLTPEEARARISELKANNSHAYYNSKDPKHLKVVGEIEALYQAANPENKS